MSKKFLITMMLCLLSGLVRAEWTLLVKLDKFTIYRDEISIRKTQTGLTIYELYEYHQPIQIGSTSITSNQVQSEYDCKSFRRREIAGVLYDGKLGSGLGKEAKVESEWKTASASGYFTRLCDIAKAMPDPVWKNISDTNELTVYADTNSLMKSNGVVGVYAKLFPGAPFEQQGVRIKSILGFMEMNCVDKSSRSLWSTLFSDQNAEIPALVSTVVDKRWYGLANDDAVTRSIFKYACSN